MKHTGLDPEFLVIGGGHLVPASLFLGGGTGPIAFDNAAAEIRPLPSKQPKTLITRTQNLLNRATAHMRLARLHGRLPLDSHVTLAPAAHVGQAHLKLNSIMSFGCSPSQMVRDDYSVRNSEPFVAPSLTSVRSAGFHIHQELTYPDNNIEVAAVAVLDGLIGLLDVVENATHGWEEQSKLRRLHLGYGRAGEYRTRDNLWGERILEYRVLSPWPLRGAEHMHHVIAAIRGVCSCEFNQLTDILDAYPERREITEAINQCDAQAAEQMLKECQTSWRKNGG